MTTSFRCPAGSISHSAIARVCCSKAHTSKAPRRLELRTRMQGEEGWTDAEKKIPGTWSLTAKLETEKGEESWTKFFTLNPDRTVTFPPGEGVDRDTRVRWKFNAGVRGSSTALQFALEAPKRSSLSSAFSDRSFQGQLVEDCRTVAGTVLDGEDEPEYVGKFDFKWIGPYNPPPSGDGVVKKFNDNYKDWDGEVNEAAWNDDE